MKRILYSALILGFSLLAVQCAKETEAPVSEQVSEGGWMELRGDKVYMSITVGYGDATKTTIDENGKVAWVTGDKIYAVAPTGGCLGSLSAEADGSAVNFTGTINDWTGTQDIHFYYVGTNTISAAATSYSYDISSQSGTLASIASGLQVTHGVLKNITKSKKSSLNGFSMTSMMSVAWFDLISKSKFSTGSSVTLTGTYNTATLDLTTGAFNELTDANKGDITLSDPSASYYVALIPGAKNMSFVQSSNTVPCNASSVIEANQFCTKAGEPIPVKFRDLGGYTEEGFGYGPGILINDVVWAPVNCGVGNNYAYPLGKLYQWGRRDGCGYTRDPWTYDAAKLQTWYRANSTASEGKNKARADEENPSYFYVYAMAEAYTDTKDDWLYPSDNTRWNSGTESEPVKTAYDPCPDGWRVPTATEMESLVGGAHRDYKEKGDVYINATKGTVQLWGTFLDGTNNPSSASSPVIFFPAAGVRRTGSYYDDGTYGFRGIETTAENQVGMFYWTSTKNDSDGEKSQRFEFTPNGSSYTTVTAPAGRREGCSVRCVKDENAVSTGAALPGDMSNVSGSW